MKKPFTLNELLEENNDSRFLDLLKVVPPTNSNGDATDEDSGDDEHVTVDNIPGNLFFCNFCSNVHLLLNVIRVYL